MKKCVYFASEGDIFPDRPGLALGFGFTPDGAWRRRPAPAAEILAVDDRFAPGPAGLSEAARFLREWSGWVLWDLERPPRPEFSGLLRQFGPDRAVVPPAWSAIPHAAVLIGPYTPGRSFARWLEGQRERFGAVVLDGGPIRHRCGPGGRPLPWTGPLPAAGSACRGACARG